MGNTPEKGSAIEAFRSHLGSHWDLKERLGHEFDAVEVSNLREAILGSEIRQQDEEVRPFAGEKAEDAAHLLEGEVVAIYW